jgi:hypothetical protein
VFERSAIADTFVTVSTLSYGTRYFWRVRGANMEGDGVFSSVWTFSTVVTPPETPSLVLPGSSSGEHSPLVRFVWRSSSHAQRYHLQVATDAPFATAIVNDSTLADTTHSAGPLQYNTTYFWRVRAVNSDWTTSWSPVWSLTIMSPPVVYDLFQNFPNPANPSTVIRYDIPAEAEVVMTLHNILGQTVRVLVNAVQKAGRYDYTLDGGNLPSGVYFYRITAQSLGVSAGQPAPPVDPFVSTKKLMILK